MPACILKLGDRYCRWSTVSDAPSTYLMTEEQFTQYWRDEFGRHSMFDFKQMFEQAKQTGCSWNNHKPADVIKNNRAGDDEKHLSMKKIIEDYSVTAEEFQEWMQKRAEYEKRPDAYTKEWLFNPDYVG